MKKENYSEPLELKKIKISDAFWGREQELVRREVIPYQWEALNDRVQGASPSYCMRNFRVAGRMMKEKKEQGRAFVAPSYTFRGFEALPEDPGNPDPDKFYGFVFQDSDFAKWIEAVGYSLINHPDPELEKIADGAIDIVCAAQAENGYLDTYYIINGMDRIFTNLRDHHELYCFGHLVEGAVSYYQATGKDKLLKAAERYADFICSEFGPQEGKRRGYPGHEIAEMALARLYELTGEKKYLELGSFFLDERGSRPYYFDLEEKERAEHEGRTYKAPGEELRFQYHQAHLPVREQSEAVGHAVRAVYLYSGMADMARLTGDEEMFAACERLWNDITEKKLYVTGGIGGTHVGEAFSFSYDLPNDTAYSETCAAIGLAFFARRMLQIRADGRYGDVMEQALYNTVLAGMALDGRSFFYVNPLEVYPEACRKDERKRHVQPVRQKWFGCACCPPNIARIVSSLGAYIYTENEDTLYTHLYVGSSVRTGSGGRALEMKLESSFPWEGEVKAVIGEVSCSPEQRKDEALENGSGGRRTLAFRIPGWCGEARAEVCRKSGAEAGEGTVPSLVSCRMIRKGRELQLIFPADEAEKISAKIEAHVEKGYLYLTGEWQPGDEIRLHFPMEVRCISANARVRENTGRVSFARGPLCYCMEEADNGKELWLLRADMQKLWNASDAGLRPTGATGSQPTGATCSQFMGAWVETSSELGHEMRILKIPGLRQKTSVAEALYGEYHPAEEEETTLTFIPYYAWNNRGEGEMSVWVRI